MPLTITNTFTAYTKIKSAEMNANFTAISTWANGNIVNADINAAANIVRSKLASGTINHVLINDGSGVMSSEAQLAISRGGTGSSSFTANGVVLGHASALTSTGAGSADQVLRIPGAGGAPAFGAIDLTKAAALSGALLVANGGTGLASYTAGDVVYASGATTLAKLGIGSAGQILKVSSGLPSWQSSANSSAISVKSGDYTLTSNDDIIIVDSSGGIKTMTIPAAASNSGKVFKLKKSSSDFNVVTIARTGSDTFGEDGSTAATSTTMNTKDEELELVSDGTSVWYVINRKTITKPTVYTLTPGGTTTPPTIATTTITNIATWWREGNICKIRYEYRHSDSTGTATGSGTYLFPLPTGLTADTANMGTLASNAQCLVGTGRVLGAGSATYITNVAMYNSTNMWIFYVDTATAAGVVTNMASTTFAWTNSLMAYNFLVEVPISGWKA